MSARTDIALVIPVYNESDTITGLIDDILHQTLPPQEIVVVDGGSTDDTVQIIRKLTQHDSRFQVIEAGRAMPGTGRNIGVMNATCDWIAFTDAGIRLDNNWLRNLAHKRDEAPGVSIIYGNYAPQVTHYLDKCATISYVAPKHNGMIRGKFIASSLLKREVWEKAGGFPGWRAAEDLVFMEKIESLGYKTLTAPTAMVFWQVGQSIGAIYKKFKLYSKWNVWAGRQSDWHYRVAIQYLLVPIAVLLSILHSWYWILLIPLWLMARVAKRIIAHREEFGWKSLFSPAIFFGVLLITVTIDMATFSGWFQALFNKQQYRKFSTT